MCVYLNSKVFLMEESFRRYLENPLYLQENAAFGKLFDGFQANCMNFLLFLLNRVEQNTDLLIRLYNK